MRYLKLFESFDEDKSVVRGPGFSQFIDSICEKYDIKNYTINDDGSIDVDGDVYIRNTGRPIMTEIPLKFRNVNGYFWCPTERLSSLNGCPKYVQSDFDCHNNELTSLEGSPEYVGGDFDVDNNQITSLVGCPKSIAYDLLCKNNKIRTLEGFPNGLDGEFDCSENPVYQLWKLFEDKDKVELFNDFGITDGEVVILERLNEFLEMIEKPIHINSTGLVKEGYKII